MGVMGKEPWVFAAAGVRTSGRRAADRSTGKRAPGAARPLAGRIGQCFLLAILSIALFRLVAVYASGLRDARYLDGWILAGGMGFQLYFHIAMKTVTLSPKAAVRWRGFHIFMGFALIAAFVSHCDFSLPDTGFEWALWTCFVVVTLSGISGTYLAWSLKAKRDIGELMDANRIASRRAELAQEVQDIVAQDTAMGDAAAAIGLPAPPFDAWIKELYAHHLRDFFSKPGNADAHLIGSQRPLKRLTDEIDTLSRFVDKPRQEKLEAIRSLAVEKDRLDFARVHLGLTKGWLLVHVPVTYALIVLTVAHVLAAYSFSSGAW